MGENSILQPFRIEGLAENQPKSKIASDLEKMLEHFPVSSGFFVAWLSDKNETNPVYVHSEICADVLYKSLLGNEEVEKYKLMPGKKLVKLA